MLVIVALLSVVAGLLTLFAGPYRAITYSFRNFGGKGAGLLTWAGVALAYPAFAHADSWAFLASWLGLVVCVYVQMMVQWCSTRPAGDRAVSQCWFGRFELAFAAALVLAAGQIVGEGAGAFFLLAYLCSQGQLWIVRAQRRLDIWTPEDTGRVTAPLLAAWAKLCAVSPVIGSQVSHVARLLAAGARFAGRQMVQLFLLLRARRQAVQAAQNGQVIYQRPNSFMGRVASTIVGHMILTALTGFIGFNILFIPFAAIAWLGGWHVSAPTAVKEKARDVISRAGEVFRESKEEALDRLDRERAELTERFKTEKEELKDKAGDLARDAAWRAMTQ